MKDRLFSLADIIRHYRLESDLTQHDVAIKANMTSGAISKIENGKTKPELRNIRAIASVLNIPYNTYMGAYIDLEKSADTMYDILQESFSASENTSDLIPEIFKRYIELSTDSYDAIEKIFNTTSLLSDKPSLKLLLYKEIINYSRSHGIMRFLAKSLFQEYMIERNDRTKLNDTYEFGRYVLYYIDLLSSDECISLHYALAAHAYALQKYEDVIHFCNLLINNENVTYDSEKRFHALGMLRESYYYCGNIQSAEEYFLEYKNRLSTSDSDSDKLFIAMINNKKGNRELAELQFLECLNDCSEDFFPYVTNEYMSFLLDANQALKITGLLSKTENRINELIFATPLERRELAWFYKLKGDYFTCINEINKALNCYIDAAIEYSLIDDINNERDCLRLMFDLYRNYKSIVETETIEKVECYYERFKREEVR